MTQNGHHNTIFPVARWEDHEYSKIQARLDLYDDQIILTKFERPYDRARQQHMLRPASSYMVDPDDLAGALGGFDIASGTLPRNCLFWQKRDGLERVGIYIPPQVWGLRVEPTTRVNRRIPLPGFVFVGHGQTYQLWALRADPWNAGGQLEPGTILYEAPVPNAQPGGICRGNVEMPEAGAGTIWEAARAFFESGFNNHLSNGKSVKYPGGVLALWKELHKAKAEAYPLDDLVETRRTLGSVVRGE